MTLRNGNRSAHGDPLTDRQLEILRLIVEAGHPTWREIGAHFGIRSTNGVNEHLRYMEFKGVVVLDTKMRTRSITVTPLGLATVGRKTCEHCAGHGTTKTG